MKYTKRKNVNAVRMIVVVMAALLTLPAASFAELSKDVAVINTPNVNVVNSPVVQSQQNGPWNVGITGTPTVDLAPGAAVTVGNTAVNPVLIRDVDVSARAPFQAEVIFAMSPGSNGASQGFFVPAGKRLVVEHVSGTAALEPGQKLTEVGLDVLQVGGGSGARHYLVAVAQGGTPGVSDKFAISQQMRLYAVGAVNFVAFRNDTVGGAQINLSVSGYLVNQ